LKRWLERVRIRLRVEWMQWRQGGSDNAFWSIVAPSACLSGGALPHSLMGAWETELDASAVTLAVARTNLKDELVGLPGEGVVQQLKALHTAIYAMMQKQGTVNPDYLSAENDTLENLREKMERFITPYSSYEM
jgi:hypothetical protein